jgi:hypothetical protein
VRRALSPAPIGCRTAVLGLVTAYAARFLYTLWPLPVDNLGSGVESARATISGCKTADWHCSGTRGPLVWLVNIGGRCGCACASVSRGGVYLYLS